MMLVVAFRWLHRREVRVPTPEYVGMDRWYCCVASEALRFGHGCAVHVEVDVRAGDVEVDVIYITFTMSAQYTGYLVPYKDTV